MKIFNYIITISIHKIPCKNKINPLPNPTTKEKLIELQWLIFNETNNNINHIK